MTNDIKDYFIPSPHLLRRGILKQKNMELILKRIAKKKGYTIGRLYIKREETKDNPISPPSEGQGEVLSSLSKERAGGEAFPSERAGGEATLYLCDTLEPQWRDYKNGARKIMGRSAIPEGRYAVVITYSPKLEQWLPLLLNVPKFSGIRIHAGNTAEDTEGCILVGKNWEVGKVLDSRIWVHRLKKKIVEAKDRGEGVWIRVE
mgnify:CR=1 FL=1